MSKLHPIFEQALAPFFNPKKPWSTCGNCGADLSNWPTSAPAHQCAPYIDPISVCPGCGCFRDRCACDHD